MKKYLVISLLFCGLAFQACEKNEVTPTKPLAKQDLVNCKSCDGGTWDLTPDTIPPIE